MRFTSRFGVLVFPLGDAAHDVIDGVIVYELGPQAALGNVLLCSSICEDNILEWLSRHINEGLVRLACDKEQAIGLTIFETVKEMMDE